MGKPSGEKVTREVGREICVRQRLKAMLLGSIVGMGSNYVITLEAINGQNGETFAQLQTEAEGKQQVLKALGNLAREMREKLGESLSSIQKYDAPIREATTSSLEALKVYSQGWEESRMGRNRESVPILSRAVEIDPNFAMAWGALAIQARGSKPELAKEAAQKAFDLRNRASEYEKQLIVSAYHSVMGDNDKATEALETMIRTYPRDPTAWNNLGTRYSAARRFEQSVVMYRKATILDPSFALAYRNLANVLSQLQRYDEAIENFRESIRRSPDTPLTYQQFGNLLVTLNRLDEAKQVYEQALAQKFDLPNIQRDLFVIASIKGDSATMQRLLDEAASKANDPSQLFWQANAAAFYGQLNKAHELMRRFAEVSTRNNQKEAGETNIALAAHWAALFGKCQQAQETLKRAVPLTQNEGKFGRAGIAMIFCGETARARR